ncbi:MAG: Na+/H+ antiporter NhaC family protein [Planctomycetes bacterium]|nr:Na+/H+ antiporter NhaC family protein [Planctomycetota bacterium]
MSPVFIAAAVTLLASGLPQDSPSPPYEIHAEPATVLKGYAFNLKVRLLVEGATARTVNGFLKIQGLYRRAAKGEGRTPVTELPIEAGEAELKNVFLDGDSAVISGFGAQTTYSPRRLPGWVSILPPLVAILLAILLREVLPALFAGIWLGALCLYDFNPFASFLRCFDDILVWSLSDVGHIQVLCVTLALGGMIGILSRSGGTKGIVHLISRVARTPRSGQLAAAVMGTSIFFDDYANCYIVGNTIRPLTDHLRVSREKLSYIVDSTAAPVATIAIISVWVGTQVGYLSDYFPQPYTTFLNLIPYSFYALFALLFVYMIVLSRRDFGPMLAAERRSYASGKLIRDGATPLTGEEITGLEPPPGTKVLARNAVVPIFVVISTVLIGLYVSGRSAVSEELRSDLGQVIGHADSYAVLMWTAFIGTASALAMAALTRALRLKHALEAWVSGCKAMFAAILILTMAWMLGGLCKDRLFTGYFVVDTMTGSLDIRWLPAITFLVCAAISFSTGTSWGTMGIAFPIVLPLVGPEVAVSDPVRFASLAAILSGAVFGDHVSPISDTTILSSMASAADHVDHVRTQMPYGMVAGGMALISFVGAGFGIAWPFMLLVGAVVLGAVIYFVGKPSQAVP